MLFTGFVMLTAGLVFSQATGPLPDSEAPLGLSKDKLAQTAQFVLEHHASSGGYIPQKGSSPSLRATLSARRSLKLLGVKAPSPEKDILFVASCVDASGAFVDRPNEKATATLASVGLLLASDLLMHQNPEYVKLIEFNKRFVLNNAKSFEEIRMGAAVFDGLGVVPSRKNDWVRQIRATQSEEGGYGPSGSRLRDTGGVIAALLRLKEPLAKQERQALIEFLLMGQGKDGGFGVTESAPSELDSSYRIGRALWMLGVMPDAKRMRLFLEKCRTPSGGYSVQPGEEPTLVDTYRALIISSWLKDIKR